MSVPLLHVVDAGDEEAGREFITEWAADHQLSAADILVETGDAENKSKRGL